MGNSKIILLLGIVFLLTTYNHVAALTFWPDTGQDKCYNNYGPITCPQKGQPFYGQNIQDLGQQASYTKLDANGNALPVTIYTVGGNDRKWYWQCNKRTHRHFMWC